jgi:hypothetical protein
MYVLAEPSVMAVSSMSSTVSSAEIEHLKKELEQLKVSTVPRAQYDELLGEVKTLTEQVSASYDMA